MGESTRNDEEIVFGNETTGDVTTVISTYKEDDDLEKIKIIEVVEEFEEIPNLKKEINLEHKNKIEDISPEFTEKINEAEEKPTIEENVNIETVVNSKNDLNSNKSSLKTIQEKSSELLKSSKENIENNEGLEKAFDKSKEVTVNLVEFIKRFVKKPVDTIENANISIVETSVLAIIQTIIVYFSLEMIDSYSFNFVKITVVMAIAYVLFIAVVYVVTYAVHTEFDAKYLYKWFATVQMPVVVWSFIGALLFWVSNYYGFVVATSLVGIISSACIGMFSAKKIVNVSRDKLAYIVPIMLIAYAGCMLFIMDQLLWANYRG